MTLSPAERVLRGSLREAVAALRRRDVTSVGLVSAAIGRHTALDEQLGAYRSFDAGFALKQARDADEILDRAGRTGEPPPLCGIPVSVKDIFGVTGFPTYAGSVRELPEDPWCRDAWLVTRAREAGAVIVGKTHTVEFAYGGVGINPNWGTPWNPWDPDIARIPGGSSCGAGVSLWERSAMIALGSDTGGSIRIPAAFTGVVGHKTTRGRWSTQGVVQLSSTFDTVGALTRSVEDSIWFFGAVDERYTDPSILLEGLEASSLDGLRVGIPECTLWEECQTDVRDVLERALEEVGAAGAELTRPVASALDDAVDHYMTGGIGKAEVHAFLQQELPGAIDLLHPTVGDRLIDPLPLDGARYRSALVRQSHLAVLANEVFGDCDVIVLPSNFMTPPPVAGLADDLGAYGEVNFATLRATCAVNLLDLCAVSLPVGLDASGMPVGLQIIGRSDEDEALLGVALAMERALGTPEARLGIPSMVL